MKVVGLILMAFLGLGFFLKQAADSQVDTFTAPRDRENREDREEKKGNANLFAITFPEYDTSQSPWRIVGLRGHLVNTTGERKERIWVAWKLYGCASASRSVVGSAMESVSGLEPDERWDFATRIHASQQVCRIDVDRISAH